MGSSFQRALYLPPSRLSRLGHQAEAAIPDLNDNSVTRRRLKNKPGETIIRASTPFIFALRAAKSLYYYLSIKY
jgi:hypothetical protein